MNILAATDLLPKSEAAIERAGFLADALKASLAIVHAVPPATPSGHTLEERLRRASSQLAIRTSPPEWHWGSQPELVVQFGHPARVVLAEADRQNAHLVVLGPHRSSALADAMSGTLIGKLLGASHCPLLIARQSVQDDYGHVVVALDDSPDAAGTLGAVESFGFARKGFATVVHAHEPRYAGMMNTVGVGPDATAAYVNASRAQVTADMRQLLDRCSSNARRYQIVIVERRPAAAILGAIERLTPDLVVLGTRGHGRFRRALLGSVANDVLQAAQCDVLLVPQAAVYRDAAWAAGCPYRIFKTYVQ